MKNSLAALLAAGLAAGAVAAGSGTPATGSAPHEKQMTPSAAASAASQSTDKSQAAERDRAKGSKDAYGKSGAKGGNAKDDVTDEAWNKDGVVGFQPADTVPKSRTDGEAAMKQ